MNVLAIGAHPDDLEFLCGGTLAKYALRGYYVTMAVLTNGNMGVDKISPPEMAAIQEEELKRSAALIAAKAEWLGLPDEFLQPNLETRLLVVDVLRRAKPNIVFAHSPNDYHPDHRSASQLVFDAAPLAGLRNVITKEEPIQLATKIYYMDTVGGINFLPAESVDITNTIELKKQMLGCHRSQLDWFMELLSVDLLDVVETVGKFRGYQAGVPYAEGFVKLEAWYRGVTERLLP